MDINSLKHFEGKMVTVILNNNNIYSHIRYKVTSAGTITFIDNKNGQECLIISSFIAMISEEL